MSVPHYIWLYLILILSIPHYFVTSNHIILLISKKNSRQILFKKKIFKLTSDLKQNTPWNHPKPQPETRGFSFPWSPRNDKLPLPDSPNPRGMKLARGLASLLIDYIEEVFRLLIQVNGWTYIKLPTYGMYDTLGWNQLWESIPIFPKLCNQVRSLSLFRWRTLTLLKI